MRILNTLALGVLVIITACESKPSLETKREADTALIQSADEWKFGVRAYQHTAKIVSFGPRPAESAALASTRAYIASELAKHGWTTIEQTFHQNTPQGKVAFTNVVARYAPAGASKAWSRNIRGILSAHIDSKKLQNFLGADDAASAAGAILEIAEYLHENHPKAANKIELVFFDGEEAIGQNISFDIPNNRNAGISQDGLYGSHHYAKTVRKANSARRIPYRQMPTFGIVLDMIGHKNLNIKIPVDTPETLLESYKAARKTLNAETHFDISPNAILDDHIPLNLYGIPTIDIIGDFNQNGWWHTTKDNMDIISKDSLDLSIRLTLLILDDQMASAR